MVLLKTTLVDDLDFFSLYLIGVEIAAKYVSLWFPQVRTSKECFYSSTDWAAGSQTAFKQAEPLCALNWSLIKSNVK